MQKHAPGPSNGAKCNISKVKLKIMQSVDFPLAVHDQQGCLRDFAGLAFDSCCICISCRQNFVVCSPLCSSKSLWICARAVSWII